jgi:hypothetical protein
VAEQLKIIGLQNRMFGDASQHARTKLLSVMEGESNIRPSISRQGGMRSALPLHVPAQSDQSAENQFGLC